jgi:hypothetical protein
VTNKLKNLIEEFKVETELFHIAEKRFLAITKSMVEINKKIYQQSLEENIPMDDINNLLKN